MGSIQIKSWNNLIENNCCGYKLNSNKIAGVQFKLNSNKIAGVQFKQNSNKIAGVQFKLNLKMFE